MDYKPHKSNAIFNISNNFITIGRTRPDDSSLEGKATESLNRSENILTVEVMNELLHLPVDTVLIPFLKRLGIQTCSADYDDVFIWGYWILDRISQAAIRLAHGWILSAA